MSALFCLKTQDHYSISKPVFFQNGLLPVFSSFDIMWLSCPIASTAEILLEGVPLGVWGHTILKFIAASHTKYLGGL